MMGRTHALTGALAGLGVGRALGLDTLPELLPFATVTAGYALVPDLDHPEASATRLLGPITNGVSWLLRRASAVLYACTKGSRDENCDGTHRHLSHTLLFALLLGGICAVSTALGGPWAVAGWLTFGVALAADRLGRIAWIAFAAGAASWLPATLAAGQPLGPAFLAALNASAGLNAGLAVALGCFVHCLGDSITEAGTPWLFPLPIAGETWYEIRPPALLRFRAGSPVEHLVIAPVVIAGCVLTLPGVLPHLISAITTSSLATAG